MRIKYFSPGIFTGLLILLIAMITGLLLSLIISFVFPDAALKFVSIALLNSFFLGLAMLLSLYLTRKLVSRLKNVYVIALSICLVFGIGIVTILMIFFMEPVIFIYYYEGTVSFLLINLLFVLSLTTIATGSVLHQDTVSAKEQALAEEKILKKEIEMKLISTKLNPHFLFNSLNLIVSMLKKPKIAELALISLSELLRYNLDKSEKAWVLLEEEIESVKKYLMIQKMRFDQRLEYEIKCNVKGNIPPLIIQPLVENSIKYNINDLDVLKINIDVNRGNNKIVIKIIDSGKKVKTDMLHKGTGLTVTQKRVENVGGTFIIKNGGIEISF